MSLLDAIEALEAQEPVAAPASVDIMAALAALEAAFAKQARAAAGGVRTRRETLREFLASARAADPDRPDWPDWWLDETDSLHAGRSRGMWQSVLFVGLCDVCDEARANFAAIAKGRRQERPLPWLGTADFHQVCALAGFDGTAVADRARRALATPEGAMAMRARLAKAAHIR